VRRIRFKGFAKNRPVMKRHKASPIGSEAPAQNPNSEVRSVLPSVALVSTACAISVAAARAV
jgi:hypothetical protein